MTRERIPQSMDEWGPVCARCGAVEFRIDGYCTIYCRDLHEVEVELDDLKRDVKPEE